MHTKSVTAFVLVLFLAVVGCTSRYAAPVDQIGDGPRFLDDGKQHRVNGGETLYAIAWMYDLDVNALARANNLPAPFTVEPGMMLAVDPRLVGEAGTSTSTAVQPSTAVVTAVPRATGLQRAPLQTAPIQRSPLPSTDLPAPATREREEPVAPVPQPDPAPVPPLSDTAPPRDEPVAPAAAPVLFSGDGQVTWDWPHRGDIVGRFTDTSVEGKGLDLSGSAGDAVRAAADGEVVYAGGGLLRYGNLLILKHNDHFLSAYAHNRALLVKEGDVVSRGQQIAELGNSGIDRDMLHFEIRQDGKPVDPLVHLPAR